MKTFTVPIYLGVRAESKAEAIAIAKALELWEASMYDLDPEGFPYCEIGLEPEVVEQIDCPSGESHASPS